MLAAGDLDTTFSIDGFSVTDFGSTSDYGRAVAVQADGKTVVGGYSGNTADLNDVVTFSLARYRVDGSLDTSFGTGGKVTTDFGGVSFLHAIVIQADGKIVAAGYVDQGLASGGRNFAIARYNSDGSLDTGFSGDGKQTTDLGSLNDVAHAVALQADGKIVAAGNTEIGTLGRDTALARYNVDGSLDTSFSGDGKQVTKLSSRDDAAHAVAIELTGKIIVAGHAHAGDVAGIDLALARYDAAGGLDPTFGSGGVLTTDLGSIAEEANGIAFQGSKIVVVGQSLQESTGVDFALARYNEDGSLDHSFMGDGTLTTDFSANTDVAYSIVVQADGKIVAAGYSNRGGATGVDFALARYNVNGSLDTAFSVDGKQTTDLGSTSDVATSVAIQPDGQIVAAGRSRQPSSGFDLAIARFEAYAPIGELLALAGDYNRNGEVDSADYVVWRRSVGQAGAQLASDGNDDGIVNQADHDVWRANFGQSVRTAGTVFLTPSPEGNRQDLAIHGTSYSDHVVVEQRGETLQARISANGLFPQIYSFPANSIDQVFFRGYEGDDAFFNLSEFPINANGDEGNDSIFGGEGDDVLAGDDGDDILVGNDGNDRLLGHEGDDIVDGGEGIDTLFGGRGDDDVFGGPADDMITGDEGADALYGELGNDHINGGADDDYVDGGVGNDTLFGADGNDEVVGGLGNDELHAGNGTDSLIGEDVFDAPMNALDVFHPGVATFTAGAFSPSSDESGGEGFGLFGRTPIDFVVTNYPDEMTKDQRNAVEHALEIWESVLVASYPGERIEINVVERASGLASASTPRANFGHTNYPSALANHIARRDIHPESVDMTIKVNVGTGQWYDGTNGVPGAGQFDLVSVVLHEVAHGLGFDPNDILTTRTVTRHTCKWYEFNCIEYTDQRSTSSIYAGFIEYRPSSGSPKRLSQLNATEYEKAQVSSNLFWVGDKGLDQNSGGEIEIYAPTTFDEGSSVGHIDPGTTNNSSPSKDFLMFPSIAGGVAKRLSATEVGMLEDMGWTVDYSHLINAPGGVTGTGSGLQTVTGDFDGDDVADIAIGMPNAHVGTIASAGAVIILRSSKTGGAGSTPIIFHQAAQGNANNQVNGLAQASDRFGSALAVGDFNYDGFDDLAVGVPGEGTDAGAVNVIYGSKFGLTTSGNVHFDQNGGVGFGDISGIRENSDRFGAALAVGDFNGDKYDDLAIGVPGEDIGTLNSAGAVNIVYGSVFGLTPNRNVLIDQNDGIGFGDLRGDAEASDLFGSSLAAGDFNGDGYDDLAIGVPGEDIGSITNAGAVNVVHGSATGLTASGDYLIDQNEGLGFGGDIRGEPEAFDSFGSSLAAGDFNGDGRDDLAIGVPNEDIGTITNAGAVNIVYGSSTRLTSTGNELIDQSGGSGFGGDIQGEPEAADFFGNSLAAGDFNGDGRDDLAIGVMGEDIGSIVNAGAVNIVHGSSTGLTPNGNYLIDQGDGLGFSGDIRGIPEEDDLFGFSVAVGDLNKDGWADLIVAVPGEDIGSLLDRGMINVIYGRSSGLKADGNERWYLES